MPGLNNINQVRSIQWSYKFLWDIKFLPLPLRPPLLANTANIELAPFNKWLPAIEVVDEMASVETTTFELANTSFEIPTHSTNKSLTVTFIDDIDLTLHHWFTSWMKKGILNDNTGLSYVADSLRTIQIQYLDTDMKPTYIASHKVFPKGIIAFNGSSESANQTLEVTFAKLSTEVQETPSSGLSSIAQNTISKIAGGIRYSDL